MTDHPFFRAASAVVITLLVLAAVVTIVPAEPHAVPQPASVITDVVAASAH